MTAPTVQVLLDNFTGAFPFDITAFLEEDPIVFSKGRPDEFTEPSAGSLTLTLDNTDSRFTLGNATYNVGLNQKIRVKVNGTNRFTGDVQSWPVAWPGGGQSFSTVQIEAVDSFARLSRTTLRSALEQDILLDSPTATYPLSEESGATTASDTSRSGSPSLSITGTGTALVFGSGVGPTDGLTCAQFNGGTFLQNQIGTTFVPSGSAFTLECYFATTMTPAVGVAIMVDLDAGTAQTAGGVYGASFSISSTGKLGATAGLGSLATTASVNDGLVHHAMMTITAGGSLSLYLDGVLTGPTAGVALSTVNLTRLSLAPDQATYPGLTTPYIGTLAHVTAYSTALSAARAAVHTDAANDHTGETPAARIARIAGYVGVTTTALDTVGSTVLGAANQGGRNALDVINETADATLGFVFLNGSGQITSVNGNSVVTDTSPDVTLDAIYADPGTSADCDMTFVINEATGGSTSSENTFTAGNAFSIGRHGLYHEDFTWNVNTDAQVVDRTNWIVNIYNGAMFFNSPEPRFGTLTFDVLTMDASNTTAALLLDVSAFLKVTGMPSQAPIGPIGGSTIDLIVQGVQWTLSSTEFTIQVNCSNRLRYYGAFILNDSFWGLLDGGLNRLYAA